jgi:hypothetical protein
MSPATKGPISQRELLKVMLALIDTARARNSSMHKDIAKSKLRALLSDPAVNWRTPFIGHNLGARRSRYLNSIGLWTPSAWTAGGWTGPVAEKVDDGE